MPGQKPQVCDFCHKRGHTEEKCWKKFPALRAARRGRQLGVHESLDNKGDGGTQPAQHLCDGNLVSTEQDQPSRLFTLPDELLLEIVAHLWTSDKNGDTYLQSLKSFSLVSRRARRVTVESLPLTVSCYCCHQRPFRQIIRSRGFLSQAKQLVLKPGLEDIIINTDSSKFNQLMSLMPRLRELNIHLKVPLGGMLSEGQLPLVKTLSVPINQVGAGCEATSIIQACPNVTRLRLNISGPVRFQTVDTQAVPRVCRPEARRALEAAAALKRLRDLELSKFPTRDTKRNARDGLGQGWVPGDLQAVVCYLPDVSSLALYGKSGIPWTSGQIGAQATALGFVVECAGMANLSRLSLTTDIVHKQCLSKAELRSWHQRDGSPAFNKAFKVFPNLQELSFVAGRRGRTWSPTRPDQKVGGAHRKLLKTYGFVNPMYDVRRSEGNDGVDRWF